MVLNNFNPLMLAAIKSRLTLLKKPFRKKLSWENKENDIYDHYLPK